MKRALRICVVGAGLAGLRFAGLAASQSHAVTVLEAAASQWRQMGMVMSVRGRAQLGDVEGQQLLVGRMLHSLHTDTDTLLPWTPNASDVLWAVSRHKCIEKLFNQLPPSVTMLEGFRVSDVVVQSSSSPAVAYVRAERLSQKERVDLGPFDLVVGCDGRYSRVRERLLKCRVEQIAHRWGGARVPLPHLRRDCVHVFPLRNASGFLHALAPDTESNEFVCTLVLHEAQWKVEAFAEIAEILRIPASLVPSTISSAAALTCVYPDAFHHDSGCAVLLGDAAHATVPFAGQGMNVALEDAQVLSNLIASEPSVKQAVEKFSALRIPEMDAMHKLGLHQYSLLGAASPEHLKRMSYQLQMSKFFPSIYPPSLYAMINLETKKTFTEAWQAVQKQNVWWKYGRL